MGSDTNSASTESPGHRKGRTWERLRREPVTSLARVGPKIADGLAGLGIETIEDLLHHFPRDYIDRTTLLLIRDLPLGEEVTFTATVDKVSLRKPRPRLSLLEVDVSDSSGRIRLTWFNQPYRQRHFKVGEEFAISGKAEVFRGRIQISSPSYEKIEGESGIGTSLEVGRIVPVYPASAEISSALLRRLCWEALDRAGAFAESLTPAERNALKVQERTFAINAIHFPESMQDRTAARRRLVVDELMRTQLALGTKRRAYEAESKAIAHVDRAALLTSLIDSLPYPLTAAQQRVIAEIGESMRAPVPMHRMLQGEVGSGKTVVAAASLCIAVAGGHQGALMAPTEVLAEQHYYGLAPLLGEIGVRVKLLTGSTRDRQRVLAAVGRGEVDVLIGTHALVQEGVAFASLGLAVIDEQHRFGVHQRVHLRGQGADGLVPDMLIMTATPIPRTLAITIYGDLDVSTLDETPPGRSPVKTLWIRPDARDKAYEQIKKEIDAGGRAFVVCPLVEESSKLEAAAAEEEFRRLTEGPLAGIGVGLLHGRMRSADKEAAMAAFRSGETPVLVATTVIEVGVDVPEATVMMIESAERFGLSQLHQLRGRIGRGARLGVCYLVSEAESEDALARIKAVCSTSDGFELAEKDLELRGEGSLFGARQAGRTDLRLTSLLGDFPLIVKVREFANELLERDPDLDAHPVLKEESDRLVSGEVSWLEFG
ncbi:MAG: DNA helicase RecG [Acidobacteria bacterium]|nr:MAG: DNA helicase RecG [Acidobacteriota bacterium]